MAAVFLCSALDYLTYTSQNPIQRHTLEFSDRGSRGFLSRDQTANVDLAGDGGGNERGAAFAQ